MIPLAIIILSLSYLAFQSSIFALPTNENEVASYFKQGVNFIYTLKDMGLTVERFPQTFNKAEKYYKSNSAFSAEIKFDVVPAFVSLHTKWDSIESIFNRWESRPLFERFLSFFDKSGNKG